jgi:hypothetical protein
VWLTPWRHLKIDPLRMVGFSFVVAGRGGDATEVAVLEPVTVALEGDDFGVVDQSVNHGGGDVIAEHLALAAEDLVAGDDQAGPFVAAGDQLEVRRFGLEWM